MRRITSLRWAAILLAAALLSGCQALAKQELKPVPKTLSHGRFVYLGNRACRRFVRRLERHQPGTRSDPFERYLAALAFLKHSFLPATDRLLFELRALAP